MGQNLDKYEMKNQRQNPNDSQVLSTNSLKINSIDEPQIKNTIKNSMGNNDYNNHLN